MFSKIPERQMHAGRWLLAIGWVILIASLFYDPISAQLTEPSNILSPFRLQNQGCLFFQGQCLTPTAYPMGARIFWGMIIPVAVVTLVAFGHEAWRRMCPLAFISQIPRALGWQRKRKVVNPQTKQFRYELALINKESWLGRNQLYVQSGLLVLGLTVRLLFVNSDRLALGIFLTLTILAAVIVGFLFGGKTWCQYFCPMAPVQMVYTGPRGLMGSEAHQAQRKGISQSMCRTVDAAGQEKSACVSCQSPCMDIDAERAYWDNLNRPDRQVLYYGYLGLVIGFYLYFSLYSGNWNFLGGAVWTETNQFATLLGPGFYLFGFALPIPKLLAVPLTLITFSAGTYGLGLQLERAYSRYRLAHSQPLNVERVRHHLFTSYTFLAFNILFFLGVYPTLGWLPLRPLAAWTVVVISAIWLYRSWGRSSEQYLRESLTSSLRRQLGKLAINFRQLLGNRTLEDLKSDEVYVLAKVLPGFSREQRQQTYQEVLKEALENGNVNSSSSLEVLQQMREQLDISPEEHQIILTELGITEPELLDPQHQLTREQRLRLESYRQALELLLLELVEEGMPLQSALQQKSSQIRSLRQEYCISSSEDAQILAELFNQNGVLMRAADAMLDQLQTLAQRSVALTQWVVPTALVTVFELLQAAVERHQRLVSAQLLSILEILGDQPDAIRIAQTLENLAGKQVQTFLHTPSLHWLDRLSPHVMALLSPLVPQHKTGEAPTLLEDFAEGMSAPSSTSSDPHIPSFSQNVGQKSLVLKTLQTFLQEPDPLVQAASLYAIHQIDPQQGREQARLFPQGESSHDVLQETIHQVLGHSGVASAAVTPTLTVEILLAANTERRVLQQPTVSIGRDYGNDIVLADSRVSRNHAILHCDAEGVSIQDLGSANGLRVGTQIIRSHQELLQQGAQIWLTPGPETGLTVHWDLQQAAPESPAATPLNPLELGTLQKALTLFEVKFFKTLKTVQLVQLAQEAEVQTFQKNDILCHQGAHADELLILWEGAADVFIQTAQTQQWVGKIEQGQTIGELGVLTRSTRSATVIAAAETVRILMIKADRFEALLNQDAPMVRQFLVMVSNRLQDTLTQLSGSNSLQS